MEKHDANELKLLREELDAGEVRDPTGQDNNLGDPTWGANDVPFVRLTNPDYGDGVSAPRGVVNGEQTLPNEREISNAIVDQDLDGDGASESIPNPFDSSLLTMTFGQYVDHGLTLTRESEEEYSFELPENDPLRARGAEDISISRNAPARDPVTGEELEPRQHINSTSPYVDQNQTYGSHPAVVYYLRESKRDDAGQIVRDADGVIVKLATMLGGALDESGRQMLPTYNDILLNNGVSQATIDEALAKNDISLLRADPNFVDYGGVVSPGTGLAVGQPLLAGVRFDANEFVPVTFQVSSLLGHFVSGDGRANENTALTAMHTIFFREHNYQVEKLKSETDDAWSEDAYFETAKIVVEAAHQSVVYNEFVPNLSGGTPAAGPDDYSGYNPHVNATIAAEFAHAVYRVGHSQINETLTIVKADGTKQDVSLVDAFLNPSLFADLGVDGHMQGSTQVLHQQIDAKVVDAVRNLLLGEARDLASINIARGRETGIASLNDVRKQLFEHGSLLGDQSSDFGKALKGLEHLKPYTGWDDFAANLRDPSLVAAFKAVYGEDDKHVNDVDLWLGGLAEAPKFGQMGTTFGVIFREQMDRLRDGDRFYYEARLDGTQLLEDIEEQSLADIIMRNTGLTHLQDNVFKVAHEIRMAEDQVAAINDTDKKAFVVGNDLDNEIDAGDHGDTLYGEGGDDGLYGGDGDDAVRGGEGNDHMKGYGGDDRMMGQAGNDHLDGGVGDDQAFGGAGDDDLFGYLGDDALYGGHGDDYLEGGAGDDLLSGGQGHDYIQAGDGHDEIMSGGGDDLAWTGAGRDSVVMARDDGVFTIKDFDPKADTIDLRLLGIHNIKEFTEAAQFAAVGDDYHISIGNKKIILENVAWHQLTGNNFQYANNLDSRLGNGSFDARPYVLDANGNIDDPLSTILSGVDVMDEIWGMGWQSEQDDTLLIRREGGNLFLDLDRTTGQDVVYQEIKAKYGEKFELSFDMSSETRSSVPIEVVWNGEVVATANPSSIQWETVTVELEGAEGVNRLAFRELAGMQSNDGIYIDNVNLIAKVDDDTGGVAETLHTNVIGDVQFIEGEAEADVFVVNGKSTDYQVGPTDDGKGVVLWNGDDFDILFNVETLRFTDKDVQADANGQFSLHASVADDGTKLYENTAGAQWITGTSDNDVFVVGQSRDGYTVERTQSGDGIVVWKGDDFDILYDFENVQFTDSDVVVSDIA